MSHQLKTGLTAYGFVWAAATLLGLVTYSATDMKLVGVAATLILISVVHTAATISMCLNTRITR